MKRFFYAIFSSFFLMGHFAVASDYLTGDWNGARQRAHQSGVDFFLKYGNDIAANPSGGHSHGWTNAGSLDGGLRINCQKTSNITGLRIYTSFSWPSGSNLSAKHIYNQFPVQQLYGGETLRLAEFYLQESLCNEKFNIKLGRLCGGNDFLTAPIFFLYVTSAINSNPIAINYNAFFPSYPFIAWGAYLDFQIGSLLFKFGAYDNNIKTWQNKYHGVNFTFASRQGTTLITEWAYLHNPTNRYALKGNYKIGGYYVTEYTNHESFPSNYGIYFLFDQMLRRWDELSNIEQGLIAWGTFLYAPPDRNSFPFFFSLGLVDQGTFASRPNDALCFGVAYGHYSSSIKNPVILPVNRSRSAETQIELNYNLQATRWLILTPVMQYIIHPQGLDSIPNAYVLGIQVEIEI